MHSFEIVFPGAPPRRYPVVVGGGALETLLEHVTRRFAMRFLVVVSDHRVFPLYGEKVAAAFRHRGVRCETLTFPAGEASKTRETKSLLEDRLAEFGAGRETVIVAVGGGVTGDLAGFVAATWHRGIPVIQAPTSLLAMADAALGGKTGVNTLAGKNQVGVFHQPCGLYADLSTLETLPERELRGGFAEVVKCSILDGQHSFEALEADTGALMRRDPDALERAVLLGIEVKSRAVTADEHERGPRAALNFGHTVAHAIEAASGWSLPHGEAVAIGLVAESRLAAARFGFPREEAERIRSLLRNLGLPVELPPGIEPMESLRAARADKKNRGGDLRICVPARIGRMPPDTDLLRVVTEGDFVSSLSPGV